MTFQTRNISALSNDEIVSAARTIVSQSNSLSAELIALLIEMDSRKPTAKCSREESESLFDLDVAGKPNTDVSLGNNSFPGSDSGTSKGTEKPIDMGIEMGDSYRVPPTQRNKVEPLPQERYKVVFTGSKELRLKIDEATGLLRHKIPSGDIA